MASSHNITAIERFPTKPRADGRFQKRINGHLYYFGSDGDRKAALAEYDRVKHDLYAGRMPRVVENPETMTAKQLANLFIDEQEARLGAKDISPGHMCDIRSALTRFLKFAKPGRRVDDLRPDDFAAYSRQLRGRDKLGPHAYNRERACVVAMFNHAADCGWIDHPVYFGKGFKKATDAELRGQRKRRFFPAPAIRRLIDNAGVQLKAMILLGVNGGFGATDCAILPRADVDLAKRRIHTVRRKRNTIRSVPLWPETIEALRKAMAERRADSLVFRRDNKQPWVLETDNANVNEVTKAFADLVDGLKIDRPHGVSFNALRHTFATLANRRQDPDAYKRIMGHKLAGLDDVYVEEIDWQRLKKITDHVRSQIFKGRGSDPSRKRRKHGRA